MKKLEEYLRNIIILITSNLDIQHYIDIIVKLNTDW
jgi:hypothetical protein